VTYARDHVFERSAVEDRRDILEAALNRGMGQMTIAQIREEFERRVQTGEFVAVRHVGAEQQYTTTTMLRMEREIIGQMQEGNRRGYNDPLLVPPHIRIESKDRHPELNAGQRQAVEDICALQPGATPATPAYDLRVGHGRHHPRRIQRLLHPGLVWSGRRERWHTDL